jgi:hypothetical protein
MHVVLLALGLVIVVAGLVLTGLGLPVGASRFGDTLIVAGTIAAVGSLILSALATVIRQLRRIAQALEARPYARAPEAEADEAPREATREATREAPRETAPLHAPVIEPSFVSAAEPRIEPMIEPLPEPARAAVPEPMPEAAEQPPPVPVDEPAPLAPKPEPDKGFDAVWSGGLDRPARETAEVAVAAVGVAVVEAVRPEPEPAEPIGPEPVRIFKSGVIDGMAYTLYTDGSIEAELPQGTVKFASIDELRAYLTARE